MTHSKSALPGFGNVGQASAELLLRKEAELKERYGLLADWLNAVVD